MTTPLLAVEDLSAGYKRLTVLSGISLGVAAGTCVCVVGQNGAGKTTLLSNIMGLFTPFAGRILLEGRAIAGRSPETLAREGLALVPEGRRIFGSLTVAENLRIGATARADRREQAADLNQILQTFPILKKRLNAQAGYLSGGEQQMLAIARALMARPKLMMIDEPSLGLAPLMVDLVYEILSGLLSKGMTLLIVEQSTARVASIAHLVYVMRSGRIVLSGPPGDVTEHELEAAYFGYDGAPQPPA